MPPKTLKLEKLFVPVPSTGMSSPFRGAANGTSRSEAGLDRAKQAFEQEKARKAAVPSLGRCVSDESIGKTCSSHVSSHHWFQVRILNPFSQSTFGYIWHIHCKKLSSSLIVLYLFYSIFICMRLLDLKQHRQESYIFNGQAKRTAEPSPHSFFPDQFR